MISDAMKAELLALLEEEFKGAVDPDQVRMAPKVPARRDESLAKAAAMRKQLASRKVPTKELMQTAAQANRALIARLAEEAQQAKRRTHEELAKMSELRRQMFKVNNQLAEYRARHGIYDPFSRKSMGLDHE
jgi:hypothetical protein